MADKIFLNSRFAFRYDTLENWQRLNPVLEKGEPSIVSDGFENKWLKIGDGVTPWNDLPLKTGWINGLYNSIFNNLKFNDENNIVGYKGYKMIGYALINEGKAVEIELRDAELTEKAIKHYAKNDKVNIEADTHSYKKEVITAIKENTVTGNTVVTLEEVDGGVISFKLEAEDGTDAENWLYVTDKYVGELIPQFSHAVVSGISNPEKNKYSVAAGYGAFAGGRNNKVYGNCGTAFGRENIATYNSFATGLDTQALGPYSFTSGNGTKTLGTNDFAIGYKTLASGSSSLATGVITKASGEGSIAGGYDSKAIGKNSFAMGDRAQATNLNAFAYGYLTVAEGENSSAFGYETKASGHSSVALGISTITEGSSSLAIGKRTQALGAESFASGEDTKASGERSVALGKSTLAEGSSSLATGLYTEAKGVYSFAGGNGAVANNDMSFAFGESPLANGKTSVAIGSGTTTNGWLSFASGNLTEASGEGSFTQGYKTKATGKYSSAFGYETEAAGNNQTVVGQYNMPNAEALFIVGCGESGSALATALQVLYNGKVIIGKNNALTIDEKGNVSVIKNPVNAMDVATKQYVDRLEAEIQILKQAIISLGGTI